MKTTTPRRAALLALSSVSLFAIGLASMQERLIFHPETLPQDYDFGLPDGAEELFLDAQDGARINALLYRAPQPSRGVVLYLHGNAGSLRSWRLVSDDLTSAQHDVLILDYRTFGKSVGPMSERGLYLDARAAYDALLARGYPPDQLILLGRSIGSGVATELAASLPCRALILETPYTSLPDLATELFPIPLIPRLILSYKLDNLSKIKTIRAPVLLIHGDRDELISIEHSRQLQRAAPDATLITLRGATHNDITYHPDYRPALHAFLQRVNPHTPP